jgi:hypothetical protein
MLEGTPIQGGDEILHLRILVEDLNVIVRLEEKRGGTLFGI